MADNFCNNISVLLLLLWSADRKKISVIKLHKTSGSKCRDGTKKKWKKLRQRSLLFKARDSRQKNASLHTGDQTRNNMSHNMSHSMSQPTMNNIWTFCTILLVLPIIELSWNHCLFSIVWSVNFVEVILVTAVNLWECCDLDMFYSELVVSWKKILYSLTL